MEFSKHKVDGLKIIKLPRDFITKKIKGFAFVGFETRA
jgi:RNA recognition motif-containing protein